MNIIAVIPARGGSKGIKDKNLQVVGQNSLVARAILAAQGCKKISRIIVSTDSDKIADEAIRYGVEVHRRSDKSSSDIAKTIEVMDEIYKDFNFTDEICVLLQPTSPLRESIHILESIQEYENKYTGSVITVTECEHHPYKSVVFTANGQYQPVRDIADLEAPRQSLEKAFRVNGAVYVVAFEELLSHRTFFIAPQSFIEMSTECSIDIDSYEDLKRANIFLEENYNETKF